MEKTLNFWKEQEKQHGAAGTPAPRSKQKLRRPPSPITRFRPPVPRKPSLDDSELFRPSRRGARRREGSVAHLAKQLDLALSPPPTAATRRRSAFPVVEPDQKASGLPPQWLRERAKPDQKPSRPPSRGVREQKKEEADLAGPNTPEKSESVMVKRRSGFTCYLDGPDDQMRPRPLRKSYSLSGSHSSAGPRRSPHPPLKASHTAPGPLIPRTMSEKLRVPVGPDRDYLTSANHKTTETAIFWDMVQRLGQQVCPQAEEFLESPVIPESLHHRPLTSRGNRRGTISLSNRGLLGVIVESRGDVPPAVFQCDVDSTVKSVIETAVKKTGSRRCSADDWLLKVCGRDEYLDSSRLLSDYEYVYQCLKSGTEVRLVLVERTAYNPSFPRKSSPRVATPPAPGNLGITRQELNTLLNSYFSREEHFKLTLNSADQQLSPLAIPTLSQSVISCVRLLCERLSFIEPPEVVDAVFNLQRACKSASQFDFESSLVSLDESQTVEDWVELDRGIGAQENIEDILSALDVLQKAVWHLISVYCSCFLPGFRPRERPEGILALESSRRDSPRHTTMLRVKVSALHRVPQVDSLSCDKFQVEACVFCGGKPLSRRVYSPPAKITRGYFPTVVWDKWLNLGIPLGHLPREARLCLTLHGLRTPGSNDQWSRRPVAWVAQRLFDSSGTLVSGTHLLGLWSGEAANPLDSIYSSLHSKNSPVLQVGYEEDGAWQVPETVEPRSEVRLGGEVKSSVSTTLKAIAQRDRFTSLSSEEQRLVWDNRWLSLSILGRYPGGLPALLLSTPHWHTDTLPDVMTLLQAWPYVEPTFGLELLHPQFADSRVRAKAVDWLSRLGNDDMVDFLPQLVQSLRYDCYLHSSMAELLLSRAAASPRIAHYLFWHLRLVSAEVKFSERFSQLLSALQAVCGDVMKAELASQVDLLEQLCAIATEVKNTRDAHRQTALIQKLKQLSGTLVGCFRLPLDPALHVWDIDIEACSFFNSNTVPLRLVFRNADPFGSPVQLIYKIGDDLRQDALILQLLRLMEKVWLRAGIDLKMVTYRCIATGPEEGMLEFVSESETLRAIQMQHGVTGSFKDKPLSEWLRRHNPTDLQYSKAVETFTASCAGYCVATYVLGVCDRHNDNIMVKRSGHMFHIDFSKILGNAQMFGNIRRDRVPFVLTPDMAYVINDGDSSRFRRFAELCCSAYNELRKHSSLFISLLSLMMSNNMPELASADDIQYVRDALMVGHTDNEATYAFTKHIEASLGSLATQINFFIHNIAQLKFSSTGGSTGLLSISPSTYSIATDGKIQSVQILAFHKRFYPETFYVYEIEVCREDSTAPKSTIFRRYREFDELYDKLSKDFPSELLPQLPGKIFMPRKSHTKQTSEKRQVELNRFLQSLLGMNRRVSESDLVYTFLHSLPRDEQDLARMEEEGVSSQLQSCGKVKVVMEYSSERRTLSIIVDHVRGLVPKEGSESADPYVKLYLLPDSEKATKRKTNITKKNLNPTYHETFLYKQLSWQDVLRRTVQLSVWDASSLLSNQCLGVAHVEMSTLKDSLSSGVEQLFVLHRPFDT